jgi:hypothetical protein
MIRFGCIILGGSTSVIVGSPKQRTSVWAISRDPRPVPAGSSGNGATVGIEGRGGIMGFNFESKIVVIVELNYTRIIAED